jgi:hypothetical protein
MNNAWMANSGRKCMMLRRDEQQADDRAKNVGM